MDGKKGGGDQEKARRGRGSKRGRKARGKGGGEGRKIEGKMFPFEKRSFGGIWARWC